MAEKGILEKQWLIEKLKEIKIIGKNYTPAYIKSEL
jgi:hypothetical protein